MATEYQGSTYKVTSDTKSTVTLTKAKNGEKCTVPSEVVLYGKRYKVTAIAAGTFTGSKIRTVNIASKYIAVIPRNAFKSSNATTVTAGNYVRSIAANAFRGSEVTKVTLGSNAKNLSEKAFSKSKVDTLVVQSKKLGKASSVKGSFQGSKATSIDVRYGKVGKRYVGKTFTKKNLGAKKVVLSK